MQLLKIQMLDLCYEISINQAYSISPSFSWSTKGNFSVSTVIPNCLSEAGLIPYLEHGAPGEVCVGRNKGGI
jgi:hypothetical protein